MKTGAFGDTVSDKATEDLGPAVEGEPDSNAGALFFFGVPLFSLDWNLRRRRERTLPVKWIEQSQALQQLRRRLGRIAQQ